ncbi:hypothetical protein TCAL_15647 [Tigriopus californicus]|uniref:CUB domain-containing protein n=1 Tax=Tigriopus californicus TaxID=6832 RepID=A0A553PC27_TIGCA|nr:hypothetical protein TCAL_15647 [Tigriopus californicus]
MLLVGLHSITLSDGRRNHAGRNGKLLSLFQIINFPNEPCIGNAGKNGTCYTPEECTTKGGSAAGTCAQGYGVTQYACDFKNLAPEGCTQYYFAKRQPFNVRFLSDSFESADELGILGFRLVYTQNSNGC